MVSDMLWRMVSTPSVMPGIIIPAIGTVLSQAGLISLQPGSKSTDKTPSIKTNIKAGPLGLAFRL